MAETNPNTLHPTPSHPAALEILQVKPKFFAQASSFRTWLHAHHATAGELQVGFHKVGSGKPSITYSQALDEALCFGWIDGMRRSLGASSYTIRFTPRRPDSIWSTVNVGHVRRLTAAGRMAPAGLAAFRKRDPAKTAVYSFENAPHSFAPAYVRAFRKNARAWAYFEGEAPWYRRTATWWVMSARKEETRERRLTVLIASSAKGRRAPGFIVGARERQATASR